MRIVGSCEIAQQSVQINRGHRISFSQLKRWRKLGYRIPCQPFEIVFEDHKNERG